jgi:DinB superfamily
VTNSEICSALGAEKNDLVGFFSSLSDEVFFKGSDERWSPAHHLAHLTFTHGRVAQGLKAKDRLPPYTKNPRPYEEVRDTYLTALKNTAPEVLANNPFTLKLDGSSQEEMTGAFLKAGQGLRDAAAPWSETELDAKGMPHPLMGLVSVREMLLFVLYHDQHHLQGVQKLALKVT